MASKKRAVAPVRRGKATTVSAGEFKTHCLRLMDEVAESGREFVITKYGKPVARLVAAEPEPADSFGSLHGSVIYQGDIVAPDHESWDDAAA